MEAIKKSLLANAFRAPPLAPATNHCYNGIK